MVLHILCQLSRPAAWTCAWLGLLLSATALSAQTACVRCTGPEQTYRCEATADEPIETRALGFFCATRIADEHSHESCATQRGVTDCHGVPVSYVYEQVPGIGMTPDDAAPADPKAGDEPRTLGEFTKDTVSASAKSVKKAGENIGDAASNAGKVTTDALKGAGSAIGNATKKTWNCLGSALNDC